MRVNWSCHCSTRESLWWINHLALGLLRSETLSYAIRRTSCSEKLRSVLLSISATLPPSHHYSPPCWKAILVPTSDCSAASPIVCCMTFHLGWQSLNPMTIKRWGRLLLTGQGWSLGLPNGWARTLNELLSHKRTLSNKLEDTNSNTQNKFLLVAKLSSLWIFALSQWLYQLVTVLSGMQ